MKYTDEQRAILTLCRKYKGVRLHFQGSHVIVSTAEYSADCPLISNVEAFLNEHATLKQVGRPKGKSFLECVCYYCGKGCNEPNPNCGRLSEIKFALQECDRAKFLADNFTYQEFEDAKKIQSEIRCKKIKETSVTTAHTKQRNVMIEELTYVVSQIPADTSKK